MKPARISKVTIQLLAIIGCVAAAATASAVDREAQLVISRLLAPPVIKAEPRFNAKLLVPPGELYDPLFMVPRGDTVWMNDDGKATDGHGSRVLSLSLDGKVSLLIPASGKVGKGVAGYGVDARFGPAGSAFAGRFFSITALNDTIYQTSPDGSCKPFADLSALGSPAGLTFSPNGSVMLVTVSPGEIVSSRKRPKGLIVSVAPDGKVDPKPVVTGLTTPLGLDVAPPGFRDGKVYRVTKEGELKLVASGFVNPAGVRFIGHHLWVTDINGDFIAGGRELPDGFLVQIDAK